LNSQEFEPSKGQTKVLKKMQKYLLKGGNVSMEIRNSSPKTKNTDLLDTNAQIPEVILNLPTSPTKEASSTSPTKEASLPNTKVKPALQRSTGLASLFRVLEENQIAHRLITTIEPSSFSKEKYELYNRYQVAIHNDTEDQLTEEKFTRFLVDTPLQVSSPYGSFHQKYYIDSQLIAVGVLDILPNCLSSVYFFYDPNFGKLSLGSFSALKEINTVRDLSQMYPSLKYYYLGYYIHTCPKMRYKAQYAPSELLCPVFFFYLSILSGGLHYQMQFPY
jgi:arginyl-tRNA---protein transferase